MPREWVLPCWAGLKTKRSQGRFAAAVAESHGDLPCEQGVLAGSPCLRWVSLGVPGVRCWTLPAAL